MIRNNSGNDRWTMRTGRILFTWVLGLLLSVSGGPWMGARAQQTTQQQLQQQQQERQRELERQREEQEREREQQQQEQERQREEQQRQREEQERQRQQQEEERQREQQQREQQQREQEAQRQREQQQQEQERQRQQQEQQQREAQERERQQEMDRQRQEQQRRNAQPVRTERPEPVLQTRPVNPEPIRPAHGPENPPQVHPQPILPDRQIHPTVGVPVEPVHRPDPGRPVMAPPPGYHPDMPHPIKAPVVIEPDHRGEPVHGEPVIVERPHPTGIIVEHPPVVVVQPRPVIVRPPSTAIILGLAPPPRRTVVVVGQPAVAPGVVVVAGNPAANYAAAQARLQAAEATCAQADAYQNNVNTLIANQNNMSQGMDQVVQAVANLTTDPDLQNALLNSTGQPNPINDALQQQLQSQASQFESMCQAKLAAAQAAMPPDPSQQAGAQQGAAPQDGSQQGFAQQDAVQQGAVQQGVIPQGMAQAVGQYAAGGAQQGNAAPQQQQDLPCNSGVTMALPQPKQNWSAWQPMGNTGLAISFVRVNGTMMAWAFLNAGSQTVKSMGFNYTYVDADSGQQKTDKDILVWPLKPGSSVGGWAAYSANTRGNVSVQITSIGCQ
jgi:hypothetical protein